MNNTENIIFMENVILTILNNGHPDCNYFTISLELFGEYLCALFNEFLEDHYYFQKFTPTRKTDNQRPIWQQGEERKNLAIITPILAEENSQYNYSKVRVVNMAYPGPRFSYPFTTYSKDYPSMFIEEPLKLAEKEFLLYFGNEAIENVQIGLGYIENWQFVPTNCFNLLPTADIDHKNPLYPFVEDFIKRIFNYKIINKKPDLDQNDMELILEEFKISRKQKLQALAEILEILKEDATEILLSRSKIKDTLNLK